MNKAELSTAIAEVIKEQFGIDVVVELSRPEPQFGDVATSVALKVAGMVGKKPHDVAEELAKHLRDLDDLVEVSIAGPGFINLRFNDAALLANWSLELPQSYRHQSVVVEYSDPNPFKVLHAGHLYTSIMGDAIAHLLEGAGANVHRVNFGGDVGMHAAKAMWGVVETLGGEHPEKLADVDENTRAEWLAARYIQGTEAFETDEKAKADIAACNKRIYALHSDNDHDSAFAQLYWTCREWSYGYFAAFYERIGSRFDKYYPESTTAERGLKEVKAQIGEVFAESDGAVVFAGEAFGLHTRVFINREGLPTYETKDVGLIFTKYDDYKFDKSVVITGNEQSQYMAVVLKAIEQFAPELAQATTHLTHGLVKMVGGVKMSSRKGNFLRAVDVLDYAHKANAELNGTGDDYTVSLGAVKYAFLKQRMGGDIIYDPDESVSIHGNSGPYLQYAHARACSIRAKSDKQAVAALDVTFDESERALALKLSEYPDILERSLGELMPHHICTYLYELAQAFNRFYERSRIIDDPRETTRLLLVERYQQTLSHGLGLLGITAPEHL